MKRGDLVTIYEDPETMHKPEGRARLQSLQIAYPDREYWEVRFYRGARLENMMVNRWIKIGSSAEKEE